MCFSLQKQSQSVLRSRIILQFALHKTVRKHSCNVSSDLSYGVFTTLLCNESLMAKESF